MPQIIGDVGTRFRASLRFLSGRQEVESAPTGGSAGEALPRGRPALFLHIPKTAGTSIVHLAAPYYGNGLISHGDYHGHPPGDFKDVPFVSGHFGYSYARPLMEGRVSFSFLREPRERILSYYYFCRSQDPEAWPVYALAQQLPLLEFLRRGFTDANLKSAIWNGQVWQLAHGWANLDRRNIMLWDPDEMLELAIRHLDALDYVGLTEAFERGQDTILDLLEIPRPAAPVSVNATADRPIAKELDSDIQEALAELTQLDQVVYDEVLSRHRLLAAPGRTLPESFGE